MKLYFYLFFLVFLFWCSQASETNDPVTQELTQEQKISQVQNLFWVNQTQVVDSWAKVIESTQIKEVSTNKQKSIPPQEVPLSEVKPESVTLQELPTEQPPMETPTVSDETPFTQEEIEVIENTSDAEIEELIDIIFKE